MKDLVLRYHLRKCVYAVSIIHEVPYANNTARPPTDNIRSWIDLYYRSRMCGFG